jgi:hypothetical protein
MFDLSAGGEPARMWLRDVCGCAGDELEEV